MTFGEPTPSWQETNLVHLVGEFNSYEALRYVEGDDEMHSLLLIRSFITQHDREVSVALSKGWLRASRSGEAGAMLGGLIGLIGLQQQGKFSKLHLANVSPLLLGQQESVVTDEESLNVTKAQLAYGCPGYFDFANMMADRLPPELNPSSVWLGFIEAYRTANLELQHGQQSV